MLVVARRKNPYTVVFGNWADSQGQGIGLDIVEGDS